MGTWSGSAKGSPMLFCQHYRYLISPTYPESVHCKGTRLNPSFEYRVDLEPQITSRAVAGVHCASNHSIAHRYFGSTMLVGRPSENMLFSIFIQTSPPTSHRAKLTMECGMEIGRTVQVKNLLLAPSPG